MVGPTTTNQCRQSTAIVSLTWLTKVPLSFSQVLSPRNSSDNQLIPLKPRPLPLSQIADKENSCGTVYGRGSRTASKNARERIKVHSLKNDTKSLTLAHI